MAVLAVLAGCKSIQRESIRCDTKEWSQGGLTGRELTTDHFTIISTLRDAAFEEALPGFVEAAYRWYGQTLPARHSAGGRFTMYLFANRSEWARFAQRHFPARYPIYARIRSGGFTEGDTSVSFFTTRAAALATIAHEGWHQYVSRCIDAPIPAWLNEGLACYHEAVQFVDARPELTPRHNAFRINNLREAIQQGRLLTLDELVRTDAGAVISQAKASATDGYYAQAWALIHFLKYGAGGRFAPDFQRLLRDVQGGSFRVRVSAAALQARDPFDGDQGAAAFRAYFDCAPNALADEYYDHLIRLAGF